MRAEDNWKDDVGKRLRAFEGDISPESWNAINQRIKSRNRRRWLLWLPAVLLLVLPVSVYRLMEPKTKMAALTATDVPENTIRPDNSSRPAAMQPTGKRYEVSTQNLQNPVSPPAIFNPEIKPEYPIALNENEAGIRNKRTARTRIPAGVSVIALSNTQTLALSGNQTTTQQETTRNRHASENPMTAPPTLSSTSGNNGSVPAAKSLDETGLATSSEISGIPAETVKQTGKPSLFTGSAASGNAGILIDLPATGHASETDENGTPTKSALSSHAEIKTGPLSDSMETSNTQIPDSLKAAILNQPELTENTAKPEDTKPVRWSFGIYGKPQYTFHRISPDKNDETMVLRLNNRNEISAERAGCYEFGFRAMYQYSSDVQVEFGLQVGKVNQLIAYTTAGTPADSVTVLQNNGQVGLLVIAPKEERLSNASFHLAGFYGGTNFSVMRQIQVTTGLGANIVLKAASREGLNNVAGSGVIPFVSAGVRYHQNVGSGLTLHLGPVVQYYLTPIQLSRSPLRAKPVTFGFSVGLNLLKAK